MSEMTDILPCSEVIFESEVPSGPIAPLGYTPSQLWVPACGFGSHLHCGPRDPLSTSFTIGALRLPPPANSAGDMERSRIVIGEMGRAPVALVEG